MLKFQKKKSIEFVLPLRPPRSPCEVSPRADLCGENFSSGFSLVEISLALLIVAIGMLAILSMFPAGLDQNARSISDTHAALFAEEVFSSLRVHAETNWNEIGQSITNLPVAGTNNWWIPADGGFSNYLDNAVRTNIYRHPGDSNIVDHAFRYRITLATNDNHLIKSAALRFWQGEYGTTNNPVMFYSEFFKLNP
jgi:prepilin-type N-terminal cleavage/methylation domain-containing protein